MILLGIDPGQAGALAFYDPDSPADIHVADMPVVDKDVDGTSMRDLIEAFAVGHAIIESVASMPGQGVSSSFKFGRNFGVALGVVQALRIPHTLVSPARWKRRMGVSADKETSRALALQLWPAHAERFRRKKDADRSEAALLAKYGAIVIGGAA